MSITPLTREQVAALKPGDQLTLDGTLRTGSKGQPLFVIASIDHSCDVAPWNHTNREGAADNRFDLQVEGTFTDGSCFIVESNHPRCRWGIAS